MAPKRHIQGTSAMDMYLEMVELTESPLLFHRWCYISVVAASLARNTWLPFGERNIYPNFYINLIGPPGSRKSSAISIASGLLREAGYLHFCGDRSSKEKFMLDWEFGFDKINQGVEPEDKDASGALDMVDMILTPDGRDTSKVSEVYIRASELEDFLGSGNAGFISTLTNLWDNLPYYTDRFKNSKSLYIPNPTVNMLGGATTTTFANIFSASIIGQGMLSRMLLIHGRGQRMKLTIPPPLPPQLKLLILENLRAVRTSINGPMTLTPVAYEALDDIYNSNYEIADSRFASYFSRRLDHLLKLCIVIAASELTTEIDEEIVLLANTILTYTELGFSEALGEFGKSKSSEVTNIVLDAISAWESLGGIGIRELLKQVSHDVDSVHELAQITMKLEEAGKIQRGTSADKKGIVFMPIRKKIEQGDKFVDYSLLWEHKLKVF